ncbi:Eco57I restriction-modification methylase domain-containing protein [Peredibacter starrii]|uniref:Eco57I restriction-modification methylase domain-containing protein n=1 Tax=Peredibacter starrii TaxID=28202 RepID=A0AAX4HU67_9BACT|nr:Eco57I restriction-modification methylase domain-containing protein [Peredibacter starrii]WPU66526.1 Eco57I restriction-modification methylase domain-containing protein [Peredibacter starrii]
MTAEKLNLSRINTHVVDILGNVKGRDQPIMLMNRAIELIAPLGEEVLSSDEYVFFDPFCKAGEILLACAFLKSYYKIHKSKPLPTVEEIQKSMFEDNNFYALAPDERHYRLSLRTFLGNEKSHDEDYIKMIRCGDYLSELDGTLTEEKFTERFNQMIEYIKKNSPNKKIIAVGNPPYQESDGGFGKSAKAVYNFFTEALLDSPDINKFILVIPSRWFGGGKGLDEFREKILALKSVKEIKYFDNSSKVFPTVDINGGVCFLHVDKDYAGTTYLSDDKHREIIDMSEFDIIPDDPKSFSIIRKVRNKWKDKYVGNKAWPSKPFGLRTNYFDVNPDLGKSHSKGVACLSKGKQIKYASRSHITKNKNHIDSWKVCAPKAAGGSKGSRRSTIPLNQIFLIGKGMVTTETYNVIDVFKTKSEAENFIAYLKTDFARYLVGLRKITQDLPPDRWNWVPYVDLKKAWNDEELCKLFAITKEERKHMSAKVEEWS